MRRLLLLHTNQGTGILELVSGFYVVSCVSILGQAYNFLQAEYKRCYYIAECYACIS